MPYLLIYIAAMFLTRAALFGLALFSHQIELGLDVVLIFGIGALYDACTLLYVLPIIIIFSLILPKTFLSRPTVRFTILFLGLYFLLVNAAAEFLFWDELGTRFNFIAVDYLIYTNEVIGNIYESYPVVKLLSLFLVNSLLLSYLLCRKFAATPATWRSLAVSLVLLGIVHFGVSSTTFELADRYKNEIAHNGVYNLFTAFSNNTLNYQAFYKTIDISRAFAVVRKQIGADENITPHSISRIIDNGNLKGYNVILIAVESLNADYLERFGSDKLLTPYLDNLSKESILFTNYYATGTRTVRGLEALMLSIPPTPGNSIVRRPNNEKLFSLGSVLYEAGYDLKFLYGGYGYFDNMNYFFENNHFKPIDRANLSDEEITFTTAWGVADEDIFKRTILEADEAFAKQNNFFYFVMTTSNHRPFKYPEGRIDIASGTGRNGAVKYTDYAIQTLIEAAKSKPWFDNTIFVITADHCAGSAGKTDLPIERYHIPLLIYAPKIFKPEEVANLSSQIDVAPTILSLLGVSYESKFYGTDIIKTPANRALISTYQKLGYYTPNHLVILGPKFEEKTIALNDEAQTPDNKIEEAVSMYQTAYHLFANGLMKN